MAHKARAASRRAGRSQFAVYVCLYACMCGCVDHKVHIWHIKHKLPVAVLEGHSLQCMSVYMPVCVAV